MDDKSDILWRGLCHAMSSVRPSVCLSVVLTPLMAVIAHVD